MEEMNRKPISIDGSKVQEKTMTNTSSVGKEENKKEENKKKVDIYLENKNKVQNQTVRVPRFTRNKYKKEDGLIKQAGKGIARGVENAVNSSNDTGVQATAMSIKLTTKAMKNSIKYSTKGIVVYYKGTRKLYRSLKVAPRKVVNAVKRIKAIPSKIKAMPKQVVNVVKNIPKRTITNVKRGTVKVVKAVPRTAIKGAKAVPRGVAKGVGKGINSVGNSFTNSNDMGIQAVGYTIKSTQVSFKAGKTITKVTINGVGEIGNLTIKLLRNVIKTITAPFIGAGIIIVAYILLIFGVVSAIIALFDAEESYTITELSVLANRESISEKYLNDKLEDTITMKKYNPFTYWGINGYHIFYYKTSSGIYVPMEEASENFINKEEITDTIKPILHTIMLIDFDGNTDRLSSYTRVNIYEKNEKNGFGETIIRGSRVDEEDKIANNLNLIYGLGNWKLSDRNPVFGNYIERMYDLIFGAFANIVTEELPMEWCNTNTDKESGKPYADEECFNASSTLKHLDTLETELNMCDYYYYLCKGNHNVLSCGKNIHSHINTCIGCGKEIHTHTNDCIGCGKEIHTHIFDSCYARNEYGGYVQICGYSEHSHAEECYTCDMEEHSHAEECYTCGMEEHFYHDGSCYKMVYHDGELASDCGYADKHRGCNGYEICQGHKVMAIGFDYASLEELEDKYIHSRYEEIEAIGQFEVEYFRIKDYIDLYLGMKEEKASE